MERVVPVPATARSLILGMSVAVGSTDDRRVTEVPDAATKLVVCGQRNQLMVVGPRTRAVYHVGKPAPLRITIRIQPGRAQLLLGRPIGNLVDRALPLHHPLARELAELSSAPDDLLAHLMAHLATRTPRDVARSDLAHQATTILSAANPGAPGVRAAAQRLHVSERHLRTLFTDAVGVSPKHFARIDRLRAVLAGAGHDTWANLAIAAGYYDQSHLTADFRRLMGVPPDRFAAGRLPPHVPCAATRLRGSEQKLGRQLEGRDATHPRYRVLRPD